MAILPRVYALPLEEGAPRPWRRRSSGTGRTLPATAWPSPGCTRGFAPRIHRFQSDLLGDRTLASDATQETFIRAFQRVGELPAGTRLVAWVFGIARNVSLELRRARGRVRRLVVDAGERGQDNVPDRACRTPEAELLDREAVLVVGRALDRLSEERRAALLLRLDHGLTYEDIAGAMGWSLAKTKVEIFRAREVLRATLEDYRGGAS